MGTQSFRHPEPKDPLHPEKPFPDVLIESTEDGGCGPCLLRKVLTFLLLHATGTGTLVMDKADLEEVGEFDVQTLMITIKSVKSPPEIPPTV